MAKRRSPYEIDCAGSSSALQQSHHKTFATSSKTSKRSETKQTAATGDLHGALFRSTSSHAEPLSGKNNAAELVLTDAERDLMAAVDAKLTALAAPATRHAASPTKQRAQAASSASQVPPVTQSRRCDDLLLSFTALSLSVSLLMRLCVCAVRHTKQQAPPPLSIDALEQKRVLLPYLDKIEYINCQLQYARALAAVVMTRTIDCSLP